MFLFTGDFSEDFGLEIKLILDVCPPTHVIWSDALFYQVLKKNYIKDSYSIGCLRDE